MPFRAGWAVSLLLLAVGCTPEASTSPAGSAAESPSGNPSPVAGSDDCPAITILGPDGAAVDLTGEWGGGEWFPSPGSGERTYMLQRGACVWASIMDTEFRADPQPEASQLGLFYGTLGSDMVVDGTLVVIYRWNDPFTYGNQAPGPLPMRLRLDFSGDGLRLLEDRQPGVQGPRCPNRDMWCPAPTVLEMIGTGAAPSPSP
jgi:hypothetical protein